MALIKNAYTPGQWYVFFYEAKNVEQTCYYDQVQQQFASWYSFLQKDQIQGKVYDFLGVPNICGKISKSQLRKIYQTEQKRFGKLDVQVKKIQLTENPLSSTKSYKFFKSKNTPARNDKNTEHVQSSTEIGQPNFDKPRNIERECSFIANPSSSTNSYKFLKSKNTPARNDKNTEHVQSSTKIELRNSDKQRNIEGTSSFTKKYSTLQSIDELNSSRNANVNDIDDSSNISEEDIFFESGRKLKESKTTNVLPMNNRIHKNRSIPGDNKISIKLEANNQRPKRSTLVKARSTSSEQPPSSPTTLLKKKVTFNSKNEHFFFNEIGSSTTHSSDAGQVEEIATDNNYSSPYDDDNAFDTGYISPVLEFSSPSPGNSQTIIDPHQSSTFRKLSEDQNVRALPVLKYSEYSTVNKNACETGFMDYSSPSHNLNFSSPQRSDQVILNETTVPKTSFNILKENSLYADDGSNDDDNAFDTGFLSSAQDFFSESSTQTRKASFSTNNKSHELMIKNMEGLKAKTSANILDENSLSVVEDDGSNDDDNAFDTGFLSPAQDFCSESPTHITRKASLYEPRFSRASDIYNKSNKLIIKNMESMEAKTSADTLNENSESVVDDDGSNYEDNAFDTGFMSPAQDFCSESPLHTTRKASLFDPSSSRASDGNNESNKLTIKNMESMKANDNNCNTSRFVSSVHELKDLATVHVSGVSQIDSESEFSVDRRISRPLCLKSTDDEALSQTSAATELFTTSIMVDLRIPGALQSVSDECMRLLNNFSSSHSFFRNPERPGPIFNIATQGKGIACIEDSTDFRGLSGPLSLTTNVSRASITISSQDKLMEIRNLNLSSTENDERNLDDDMSKTVERVSVSSMPFEINSISSTKSIQDQSSYTQPDSIKVNVASPIKVKIRNNKSPIASSSKTEHLTALNKKRLPLKKRSLTNILESMSLANVGSSSQQISDIDEKCRPAPDRVVEKNQSDDPVGSVAVKDCSGSIQISPYDKKFKPVEDAPHRANIGMMKTKKHNVDLSLKLSMKHISEQFFNDPDIYIKYRESSLSCSAASRRTSSKSTIDRQYVHDEPHAGSNLASSVAHELEEMDLNPQDYYVGDAETPLISEPSTKDLSGSPSPQSTSNYDSEIVIDSPFVRDFIGNTKSFLQNERERVSQIYDMETPIGKATHELTKTPKMTSAGHDSENASTRRPVVDRNANLIQKSLDSRLSIASSPSDALSCWNNESKTPSKKHRSEYISSGSDDSLRVLPSTSQQKHHRKLLRVDAAEYSASGMSSKNSDQKSRASSRWNDELSHSKMIVTNVNNPHGDAQSADSERESQAENLKSIHVVPLQKTGQGERMSFVSSDVITKPFGSERQLNEHNFLICEDEESPSLSLSLDE